MKQWNGVEVIENWNGFPFREGEFMGMPYIVISPKENPNGKWAIKTEYFGAFPQTEIALLEKGYHVAHIDNAERYCPDSVTKTQAAFIDFVHTEFGLSSKCVPVGMSCGGLQAIYLAAKHPEKVSCMFIDAPLINFLCYPFGFGTVERADKPIVDEFIRARGVDEIGILSFREHPLDYIPKLASHKIPVFMVIGGSDVIVPYAEHGKHLQDAYEKVGATIETHIVPGRGHHPHGLADVTPIIEFIEKYSDSSDRFFEKIQKNT